MAAQASTNGKERVIFEVTPREKKILEALSIVWRRSIADIVRTCVRPVLDQHEEALDRVEEIRCEAPEEMAGSA